MTQQARVGEAQILSCYDGSNEARSTRHRAGDLRRADELDAAVIVIGSRSPSGAREFARGSLSHDVSTHARHPVLIVAPLTEGAH